MNASDSNIDAMVQLSKPETRTPWSIVARLHSRKRSSPKQEWEPRSGAMQDLTPSGTVGTDVCSRSRITSDADHRYHHQDNRYQNHGDANIVSRGPFRRYPIEICRRPGQWIAKQDGVSGIVKLECDNVA